MKIKIVSCGRWWKYLPEDWEVQPAPSAAEAGPPACPLPLLSVTRTCKIQPGLTQRTSGCGPCYLCGECEGMYWWVVVFLPLICLHGGCVWKKVKGVSLGGHVWAGPGHGGWLMGRRVPCPGGTSVVKPVPMNETQHHELPQELWLGRGYLSLNSGSPRSQLVGWASLFPGLAHPCPTHTGGAHCLYPWARSTAPCTREEATVLKCLL